MDQRVRRVLAEVCSLQHAQRKTNKNFLLSLFFKNLKICQIFKPVTLPRRLFRAQTSHGSKQEAGDVWSKTRFRHCLPLSFHCCLLDNAN